MNDDTFWFWLSVVANICQIESYQMNIKQVNNDSLLNYLKHQDQDFLKIIISQNEEIIRLLKEEKNED